MRAEDKFILDFLPILRTYLHTRQIQNLDQQLEILENQLQVLKEDIIIDDESDVNDDESDVNDDESDKNSNLHIDLTLYDLDHTVQEWILTSLGFSSIEEALKLRPDLDGPIGVLNIKQ